MKPEFKASRGKIEVDAPKGKKPIKVKYPLDGKRTGKGGKVNPTDAQPFNDITWYTKYPALFEDAATVGFNHIKGTEITGAFNNSSLRANYAKDAQDTNVLCVRYITAPGVCDSPDAGFEMQIRRLYLAMKRKYRGLNTYQVPDLGVTLFCIGEFYRMIARLERIYGVVNYYNAVNRIMPKTLPVALRFDYDDLSQHLADFRAGINALIARAHSLCLPNGLDFVNRWFLLESNVFKDSEGERASYIVFDDKDTFYTYQPKISSTGGCAMLSDINSNAGNPNKWTYDELLSAASDMLGLLLGDDDVTLQLGDIISYFTKEDGNTDLLVLTSLPVDYMVTPVYNQDVLLQLHNSTTIGRHFCTRYEDTITESDFDNGANGCLAPFKQSSCFTSIWQHDGHLSFLPYLGSANYTNNTLYFNQAAGGAKADLTFRPGNLILDTWENKPSAEHVMEMTRLTTTVQVTPLIISNAYYHQVTVSSCGTEMVIEYVLFTPSEEEYDDGFFGWSAIDATIQYEFTGLLAHIDWHPIIYHIGVFDTSTTMGSSWEFSTDTIYADLDNMKVFTPEVISRIHDAAIMSLFDVSSVKALLPSK